MEEAAKQVGDSWFAKMVALYKRYPLRVLARYIAWMFHSTSHRKVTDRLIEQIDEAAACYPRRHFGEEQEKHHTDLLKRAKMRKKELEEQGIQAKIYREEPFMVGDDTPFKIYVMKFKTKNGNRTSQIEEIR